MDINSLLSQSDPQESDSSFSNSVEQSESITSSTASRNTTPTLSSNPCEEQIKGLQWHKMEVHDMQHDGVENTNLPPLTQSYDIHAFNNYPASASKSLLSISSLQNTTPNGDILGRIITNPSIDVIISFNRHATREEESDGEENLLSCASAQCPKTFTDYEKYNDHYIECHSKAGVARTGHTPFDSTQYSYVTKHMMNCRKRSRSTFASDSASGNRVELPKVFDTLTVGSVLEGSLPPEPPKESESIAPAATLRTTYSSGPWPAISTSTLPYCTQGFPTSRDLKRHEKETHDIHGDPVELFCAVSECPRANDNHPPSTTAPECSPLNTPTPLKLVQRETPAGQSNLTLRAAPSLSSSTPPEFIEAMRSTINVPNFNQTCHAPGSISMIEPQHPDTETNTSKPPTEAGERGNSLLTTAKGPRWRACDSCSILKASCSERKPCERCLHNNIDCKQSFPNSTRSWTLTDIKKIIELRGEGRGWDQIAGELKGKTSIGCRLRYSRIPQHVISQYWLCSAEASTAPEASPRTGTKRKRPVEEDGHNIEDRSRNLSSTALLKLQSSSQTQPGSRKPIYKRSWDVCDGCRSRKLKCSGDSPCQRCKTQNIPCIMQVRKRKDKKSLKSK